MPLTLQQATANPRLCGRFLDTHRQVSLLWCRCSFLLGPGDHRVLFVPSKRSVSLTLCKFCSKIPLAFKVKFPGGSQYLCQIPRLGNLLWALELSQQCKNFFGIIVLQFVGCLLGDSMLGLTHCLPGLLQPEPLSPWQVAVELCLRRSHSNTQSQGSLSLLWGLWVLVHKRFCLSPPSVSGGCGV